MTTKPGIDTLASVVRLREVATAHDADFVRVDSLTTPTAFVTLEAILDEVAAALHVEPEDLALDGEGFSLLVLAPLETTSPEPFSFDKLCDADQAVVLRLFQRISITIALTIARVPRAEFAAAFAAFRLGGLGAVNARWKTISNIAQTP